MQSSEKAKQCSKCKNEALGYHFHTHVPTSTNDRRPFCWESQKIQKTYGNQLLKKQNYKNRVRFPQEMRKNYYQLNGRVERSPLGQWTLASMQWTKLWIASATTHRSQFRATSLLQTYNPVWKFTTPSVLTPVGALDTAWYINSELDIPRLFKLLILSYCEWTIFPSSWHTVTIAVFFFEKKQPVE